MSLQKAMSRRQSGTPHLLYRVPVNIHNSYCMQRIISTRRSHVENRLLLLSTTSITHGSLVKVAGIPVVPLQLSILPILHLWAFKLGIFTGHDQI